MTLYIEVLEVALIMWLVETLIVQSKMMMKKKLNEELAVKLIMGMISVLGKVSKLESMWGLVEV